MFQPDKEYQGYKDRPMLMHREGAKIFYSAERYVHANYVFATLPYPFTLVYLKSFDLTTGIATVEIDHCDTFNFKHYGIYLSWNNSFLRFMDIREIKRYHGY